MRDGLFTIGEISRICKVNPSKLRYYDEIGVIKPSQTDESSGYRYYSNETIQFLQLLDYYQVTGYLLKDIPVLLRRDDLKKLDARFLAQTAKLDEEIHKYQMMRDSIVSWHELIDEAREVFSQDSCPIRVKRVPATSYYIVKPEIFAGMDYTDLLINPTLCHSLTKEGLYTTGALYLAYPHCDHDRWRDARLLIRVHPEQKPPVRLAEFSAFSAVSCYHRGPFDSIPETVKAMQEWAQAQGHRLRGYLLERSVIDCWSITDKEQWLMEILLPLAD
ncbi:MAG: MerR family transcriptional regulator [Coriobacteriales bacterium]|jgi:DNA-binding transcriptional MerR regulator/effector-binding domain-containing protein|nr:MerR family transcriptional regulator [Coriobacteriales bacterium]